MNKLIFCTFLYICLGGILFAGEGAKTGVAVKTDNPPNIDGEISNQEWSKAVWRNSFVACPGDAKARQQTRFAVMFDPKNIYIALKCNDIHYEKIKPYPENDINIWRHDSLELFFQSCADSKKYKQFLVSAGGGRYGLKFNKAIDMSKKEIPFEGWRAAAKMTNYGYAVEVEIPLGLFENRKLSDGIEWRFNIHRNTLSLDSDRYSSWSPVSKFHNPTEFGYLIFAFSNPKLIQNQITQKRKYNRIVSEVESFRRKYAKIDMKFLKLLNAKLESCDWMKFKTDGEKIMKMNLKQLQRFKSQISAFDKLLQELKLCRSDYLMKIIFKEP